MAHVRKQIRDAVIVLLTGLATTGSNVGNRVYAKAPPYLRVSQSGEDIPSDRQAMGSVYYRRVTLQIVALVEGVDLQDQLDQIAVEVEEAIEADDTLGGLVLCIALTRTDFLYEAGAEEPRGEMTMIYEADYRTAATDPETSIS